MDGSKGALGNSLQRRLSQWLTGAILAVAVLAGAFSYVMAYAQAHDFQDDLLKQMAALFSRNHLEAPPPGQRESLTESEEDARVVVQRLDRVAGAVAPADLLNFPATLHEGLQTVDIGDESYRVLVVKLQDGGRLAVAQQTDERDELAQGSALSTVAPMLVLVPLLIFMVTRIVRRLFVPVARLADDVDQRDPNDLRPLDAVPVPEEIRPFALAMNRLLARVEQAMGLQRRFMADAAHELRTPLTALSLQAERLDEAGLDATARTRLAQMRQGIERNRQLVDQLLAFTRVQAVTVETTPVSLPRVCRQVVEGLMPLADARGIDIGIDNAIEQLPRVMATELDLVTLVRNLVDNAMRYSPAGGRVDVRLRADAAGVVLEVRDEGPGIAAEERERVFDPFYRVLGNEEIGSGLGLSIVRAICQRLGASVSLAAADTTPDGERGLLVTVWLPAAPAPA